MEGDEVTDIRWDKKYSIGHERIDHEHQVFLDLIHNVALAGEVDTPREEILRLLTELKLYAEFHFFSEENIMLNVKYPDYEKHRNTHELLLANLEIKRHEYILNDTNLSELVTFLFDWFVLHTTIEDKKIAAYIYGEDWLASPPPND